jgi:hypothetical protein
MTIGRAKDAMRVTRLQVSFNDAELLDLAKRAAAVEMTDVNYIRHLLGMLPVWPGKPQKEEVDARIRDAYERLERLGENPCEWFSVSRDGG